MAEIVWPYRRFVSLNEPPSQTVLHAFGVREPPTPLTGGQGASWRAGDLVLKPDAGPLQEWLAAALPHLTAEGFRVAMPVASRDGAWQYQGWSASQWIDGVEPDYSAVSAWQAILTAGRAFHRATADLPRPRFLGDRQDWWARADRAVWGERTIRFRREFADLARRLQDALRPLGRSQIVHADLTQNVLFAEGRAPAIIDISPYWRPPAFAEGIVVADALCWHDADPSLPSEVNVSAAAVARGLLFRMATTNERLETELGNGDLDEEANRYAVAATAIGV
ncbi:hypothetical protein [Cryptosporangium aurantiacum]|uniref:TIGR02569 family protein n=1 Tax=Cryptosporangium aurantiacum TaxID=134849 RepID=A0A1M7REP2_9ACTN|nr:hypothetical protein [Cryptosporangium aurantiacum]SHN44652.1 TIGR02569 family protein [Cryptosporangium aurantiacum]